jgi:predicted transcriptional regulator
MGASHIGHSYGHRKQQRSICTNRVSAYVSNNTIRPEDLGSLIAGVHSALQQAPNGKQKHQRAPNAGCADQEIRHAGLHHLLENGQKFKSIKRHLMNSYGMTPDEYRPSGACPATIRWLRRTMQRPDQIWRGVSALAGRHPLRSNRRLRCLRSNRRLRCLRSLPFP